MAEKKCFHIVAEVRGRSLAEFDFGIRELARRSMEMVEKNWLEWPKDTSSSVLFSTGGEKGEDVQVTFEYYDD